MAARHQYRRKVVNEGFYTARDANPPAMNKSFTENLFLGNLLRSRSHVSGAPAQLPSTTP